MNWLLESRRFYGPISPVWVRAPDVIGLERGNHYSYFKQAWGERSWWGWKWATDNTRVQSTCCEETGSNARQVLASNTKKACSVSQVHWCFCMLKTGNSRSECSLEEKLFLFLSPSFLYLMQTSNILWTNLAHVLCPSGKDSLCSTACLHLPLWWMGCGEEKVEFGCLSTFIIWRPAWESVIYSCNLNRYLIQGCAGSMPLTGLPLSLFIV